MKNNIFFIVISFFRISTFRKIFNFNMDRLVGTWTLESSENFEEFLVALGNFC